MNTLDKNPHQIIPQNPYPFSGEDYRRVIKSIQVYCEAHPDPQILRVKQMIADCKRAGMI